jgi:hypothetical protein
MREPTALHPEDHGTNADPLCPGYSLLPPVAMIEPVLWLAIDPAFYDAESGNLIFGSARTDDLEMD